MPTSTPGLESDVSRLCDSILLTVDQADALLKCIDLANQHPDQAPDETVMTHALGGVAGLLEQLKIATDVLRDLAQSHAHWVEAEH